MYKTRGAIYNLQVFILKLQGANYELKIELQFSKKFAESSFATASYQSFL